MFFHPWTSGAKGAHGQLARQQHTELRRLTHRLGNHRQSTYLCLYVRIPQVSLLPLHNIQNALDATPSVWTIVLCRAKCHPIFCRVIAFHCATSCDTMECNKLHQDVVHIWFYLTWYATMQHVVHVHEVPPLARPKESRDGLREVTVYDARIRHVLYWAACSRRQYAV